MVEDALEGDPMGSSPLPLRTSPTIRVYPIGGKQKLTLHNEFQVHPDCIIIVGLISYLYIIDYDIPNRPIASVA